MAWFHKTGEMPKKQADCFKEECSWFNRKDNECSMVTLAWEAAICAGHLSNLVDKLPPARP